MQTAFLLRALISFEQMKLTKHSSAATRQTLMTSNDRLDALCCSRTNRPLLTVLLLVEGSSPSISSGKYCRSQQASLLESNDENSISKNEQYSLFLNNFSCSCRVFLPSSE